MILCVIQAKENTMSSLKRYLLPNYYITLYK